MTLGDSAIPSQFEKNSLVPLPKVLELAASRPADSTALDPAGSRRGSA